MTGFLGDIHAARNLCLVYFIHGSNSVVDLPKKWKLPPHKGDSSEATAHRTVCARSVEEPFPRVGSALQQAPRRRRYGPRRCGAAVEDSRQQAGGGDEDHLVAAGCLHPEAGHAGQRPQQGSESGVTSVFRTKSRSGTPRGSATFVFIQQMPSVLTLRITQSFPTPLAAPTLATHRGTPRLFQSQLLRAN